MHNNAITCAACHGTTTSSYRGVPMVFSQPHGTRPCALVATPLSCLTLGGSIVAGMTVFQLLWPVVLQMQMRMHVQDIQSFLRLLSDSIGRTGFTALAHASAAVVRSLWRNRHHCWAIALQVPCICCQPCSASLWIAHVDLMQPPTTMHLVQDVTLSSSGAPMPEADDLAPPQCTTYGSLRDLCGRSVVADQFRSGMYDGLILPVDQAPRVVFVALYVLPAHPGIVCRHEGLYKNIPRSGEKVLCPFHSLSR